MKYTAFFLSLLALSFLCSCAHEKSQEAIIQQSDYQKYLETTEAPNLIFAKKERAFWQKKYTAAPNQVSYLMQLANAHTMLFEATGDVNHLAEAGVLLEKANQIYQEHHAGTLRALAKNYTAQHRFREALRAVEKAYTLGEGKLRSQQMLFDVHLELGNREEARELLLSFENRKDFNYLIRASKWADHEGDLEMAISQMEAAKTLAEAQKSDYLRQWAYTNIADYYGHAGRIEDSYQHYLKALKIDNNDSYALRGIAWIAFSHEKNTTEAKRILNVLTKAHPTPDVYLLKAEIADYEGNTEEADAYLNRYLAFQKNPAYGDMYNAYNIELFAEQEDKKQAALKLAIKEVMNRPTPQAYDLLAYSYLKNGDTQKALDISQKKVLGKTFEPLAQYHLAEVYKANGMTDEVASLKTDLLEAGYELGPNMLKKIEAL